MGVCHNDNKKERKIITNGSNLNDQKTEENPKNEKSISVNDWEKASKKCEENIINASFSKNNNNDIKESKLTSRTEIQNNQNEVKIEENLIKNKSLNWEHEQNKTRVTGNNHGKNDKTNLNKNVEWNESASNNPNNNKMINNNNNNDTNCEQGHSESNNDDFIWDLNKNNNYLFDQNCKCTCNWFITMPCAPEDEKKQFATQSDFGAIVSHSRWIKNNQFITASLLLNLNQRNWQNEWITWSNQWKASRWNTKTSNYYWTYLRSLVRLQSDFNWISFAIALFYQYNSANKDNNLLIDSLPPVSSANWINGFQWKGLTIKMIPYPQSKQVRREIKALNYLFLDYLQVIDTKGDQIENCLSNEIIFPLVNYSEIDGYIILVSQIIYTDTKCTTNPWNMNTFNRNHLNTSLLFTLLTEDNTVNAQGKVIIRFVDNIVPCWFNTNKQNKIQAKYNFYNYEREPQYHTYTYSTKIENKSIIEETFCIKYRHENVFENTISNIEYKVYFNKGEDQDNTFVKKGFFLNENPRTQIGNYVIMYRLKHDVLLKYSLIKSSNFKAWYSDYVNNSNYCSYFDSWCRWVKDNVFNHITNWELLRKNMKQYGINKALSLSVIIKTEKENRAVCNYLKIGILTAMIRDIISEGSLACDRIEKVLRILQSVLLPNEIHDHAFFEKFYSLLAFRTLVKVLEYKIIDEYWDYNYIEQNRERFKPKTFLTELILACRDYPQIFISTWEKKLNFNWNPTVKYIASLSLESWNKKIKIEDISITPPVVKAYIKAEEINYYLWIRNISQYNHLETSIMNNLTEINLFVNNSNNIMKGVKPLTNSLIDIRQYNNNGELLNRSHESKIKQVQNSANPNNQTIIQCPSENSSLIINPSVTSSSHPNNPFINWRDISTDLPWYLPSTWYKQKLQSEEYNQISQKDLYCAWSTRYSIHNSIVITNWLKDCGEVFKSISSINYENERCWYTCHWFSFVNCYFMEVDDDYINRAKERFITLRKEIHYGWNYYWNTWTYENLSVLNILETWWNSDYIKSEEYFSKCWTMSLYTSGDPRGRNNIGHGLNWYPLWKLARKTMKLETEYISEYFKEMYHCQYYNTMKHWEPQCRYSNVTIPKQRNKQLELLNTINRELAEKPACNANKNNELLNKDNYETVNSWNNIDECSPVLDHLNNNLNNLNLCESNWNYENVNYGAMRKITFPNVSDKTNEYQRFFSGKTFMTFLIKQILLMEYQSGYPNENLFISPFFQRSLSPQKSKKSSSMQGSIFSIYWYDYWLNGWSFKKNSPSNIVFSFGHNINNQTGHDNYDILALPRMVFKLKDLYITKIYCGWDHNLVLTKEGDCYAFGNNKSFQCGSRNTKNKSIISTPVSINALHNTKHFFTMGSCGNEHSLLWTKTGEVYAFGSNCDGLWCADDTVVKDFELVKIEIPNNEFIISVSCGTVHSVVLSREGNWYSWGSAQGGQLGWNEGVMTSIPGFESKLYINTPTRIEELHTKIVKISSGEAHTVALTEKGQCYSWGFGSNGQLGWGFCEDSYEPGQGMIKSRVLTPRLIYTLPPYIIDIQCGKTFSLFITDKRELLACGVNDLNQWGVSEEPPKKHLFMKDLTCYDFIDPIKIESFLTMKVEKVSCGEGHCLAVISDNYTNRKSLWGWGNNRFGQIGLGRDIKKSLPKPIPYFLISQDWNDGDDSLRGFSFEEIACGGFHSLCLINNSTNKSVFDIEKEFNDMIKVCIDKAFDR